MRMAFKVSAEEIQVQEYIPVWAWSQSTSATPSKFPTASAAPSKFPPASPAKTGKAEGKSEEGGSGGGPQVAAERPQIPRVYDPLANLREAMQDQTEAQQYLEDIYEAFCSHFSDEGHLTQAINKVRETEKAVEEKLRVIEDYLHYSQDYISEAQSMVSESYSGNHMIRRSEKAILQRQYGKKTSGSNKARPQASAAASSTQDPNLQSILEQVKALDLSPEEAAQLRKALKKEP